MRVKQAAYLGGLSLALGVQKWSRPTLCEKKAPWRALEFVVIAHIQKGREGFTESELPSRYFDHQINRSAMSGGPCDMPVLVPVYCFFDAKDLREHAVWQFSDVC
ncbi:MAG: hypothetical protein AAGF50_07245 [Pseudomonadota bacterium]